MSSILDEIIQLVDKNTSKVSYILDNTYVISYSRKYEYTYLFTTMNRAYRSRFVIVDVSNFVWDSSDYKKGLEFVDIDFIRHYPKSINFRERFIQQTISFHREYYERVFLPVMDSNKFKYYDI